VTGGDEPWRCFVAVPLPDSLRDGLDRAVAPARRIDAGVRWTRPAQWHLTCKFLGDVAPGAVEPLRAALAAIDPPAPFRLAIEGLGRFPERGRPRVFWAGVTGDVAAFAALARAVETALAPLGFPRERRAFNPHLTLARVKHGRGLRELEAEWQRLAPEIAFELPEISTFRLYRSTLDPAGAVHRVIAEFG
jgi:2'-5' RNA ligase